MLFYTAGFYAYLSLLTVINAHDHPVVKVFTQVLMDQVKKNRNDNRGDLEIGMFSQVYAQFITAICY